MQSGGISDDHHTPLPYPRGSVVSGLL